MKCILAYVDRIDLLAVINSVLNFDALRVNIQFDPSPNLTQVKTSFVSHVAHMM